MLKMLPFVFTVSCGGVCGLEISVMEPGPYTCDELSQWADVVTQYSPPRETVSIQITDQMPEGINGIQDGGLLTVRPINNGICQTAAIHEYLHFVHGDKGHLMGHIWGTTDEFRGDGTEQRLRIQCDALP